jgi:radical SAM protein with 4Fe4S-binding SPASM domain
MSDKPLCIAPFSSLVIDPTKKVFPCCAFDNKLDGFGNLENENISTIVNNASWSILRDELAGGRLHKGCSECNQRGEDTGWTLKNMYQDDGKGYNMIGWEDGRIRQLELSGSNICNLACLHCNNSFSSEWSKENLLLGSGLGDTWYVPDSYGNPELLIENLSRINLTAIKRIEFKGGEPLLNPETVATLAYLKNKNLLSKVDIFITTNATIVDDAILELLAAAKFVQISISVDGPDKLNQYIRYGRTAIASSEVIEKTIQKYNALPRVKIGRVCSVMVYNIFRLVEVRDWWSELKLKYKNIEEHQDFNVIVTSPEKLNIRVLTDKTRQRLIKYYTEAQNHNEFNTVIRVLEDSYLGTTIRNEWIDYTINLDRLRGNNVLTAEPLLATDFVKE